MVLKVYQKIKTRNIDPLIKELLETKKIELLIMNLKDKNK